MLKYIIKSFSTRYNVNLSIQDYLNQKHKEGYELHTMIANKDDILVAMEYVGENNG